MSASADKLGDLGQRSDNPILRDFASVTAQYRRAYVQAVPTYSPADGYLANVAAYSSTIVLAACAAVGG